MSSQNPYAAYQKQARLMKITKEPAGGPKEAAAGNNSPAGGPKIPVPQVRASGQMPLQQPAPTRQPGHDYLTNAIMTASPEELTLFLYRGAVKFMKQTMEQIEAGNISEANSLSQRAQSIFRELVCSLDMEQEISHHLYHLYQFIIDSLIKANIKKDLELVDQMIELTTELGSTWQEAMKLAKQQGVAGTGG